MHMVKAIYVPRSPRPSTSSSAWACAVSWPRRVELTRLDEYSTADVLAILDPAGHWRGDHECVIKQQKEEKSPKK
jgi:hypothetical protein